jgi:glycosyltransferase involved in cell wall biosynthesis
VAHADRRRELAVPRPIDELGDDRPRVARPRMTAVPMTSAPNVVYVVPDKMGGMMNIIANLLAHRRRDDVAHHAILTHNHLHTDTRFGQPLAADSLTTIEYTLPTENLHAVMRRLAAAVPPGGGVYVAGDLLDLATASVHDFGRAVIYMLHGDTDYYYDLAVKHDAVVHAFIAYSRRMYETLLERLPHRTDTIVHLPYGIEVPPFVRRPSAGPLRVVFAGRFEQHQKGVFDLPEIDRALRARGVHVAWTVAGGGPDECELKRRWAFNPHVQWKGRLATADLLRLYVEQDLFVLPTRFEGFPVALLEAMAVGVVPVVSDIESGVPEIVKCGTTGIRPPIGDVVAFADAIARLDANRVCLEAMSTRARGDVSARFDICDRVGDYQALYGRWRELYRPLAARRHLQYGSRLDRAWLPNPIVRLVRSALAQARM